MIGRSNWRASASTAALTVALALGGVAPAVAATQPAQQTQTLTFDIPAGPLGESLRRYAEATGLQAVYSSELIEGVRSAPVQGRYSAAEALSLLLSGTGLSARQSGSTIALEPASSGQVADDGSRILGPVRVEGAESRLAYSGGPVRGDGIAQLGGVRGDQDGEATGYRPNVATVSAGAPTAIEDIPRSISVLTQEQIQKQDIQTIGDALERLPGVTVVQSNNTSLGTGAFVVSRGFDLTKVQIDGGSSRALNLVGNGMLDLSAYERVELVRGPNAVFAGAGSPGGSLNLVRKRPGRVDSFELSGILDNYGRRQFQLDVSTPALGGSSIAFRGVASVTDQEFYYDHGEVQSSLLYAIFDAPLGDRARIEFGLQHSRIDQTAPYSGQYRYLDGPVIDFGGGYYNNVNRPWSYDNSERTEAFARLFIDVMDDIDMEVGIDLDGGSQRRLQASGNMIAIQTGDLVFSSPHANYSELTDMSNVGVDFKLTGRRSFWGFDHNFLIAAEMTASGPNQPFDNFSINNPPVATIAEYVAALDTFTPALYPYTFMAGAGSSSTQSGVVLADVISWRDRVELTLGVRRYDSESSYFNITRDGEQGGWDGINLGETGTGLDQRDSQWVPSWAIAFKPTANLTFFGTQAEGQEVLVVPRYTVDGGQLGPTTYENLEVGVKFATDRLYASLSYYDLLQENIAQTVLGSACPPSNTVSTPCYEPGTATQQSKGVDFEAVGELFPGFTVSANYTWAKTETIGTGENFSTLSPTHAAQVFVDWSPGYLPRTSFRGGLRYRSEVYQSGNFVVFDPFPTIVRSGRSEFTEDAYLVMDLGVQHQLTPNVLLDLFVENVTDEKYLSTVSAQSSNFPGAPRTFTATLRWKRLNDAGDALSGLDLAPFGDPADWYAAADFGSHALDDLEGRGSGVSQDGVTPVRWNFETQDGAAATVRLGYRLSASIRTELEGAYRAAEFGDIGGGAAAPFGVCSAENVDVGVPFDCEDALGDASVYSVMANALYDFGGEQARFRPFIGAGLGIARTSIDFSGKLEGIGDTTPWPQFDPRRLQEGIAGDSTNIAFAYQLLGGLSFRISPQAAIEATYRYFNAPEVEWASFNLGEPGGYPQYGSPIPNLTNRVGDFSAAYEDHALTVGLRWTFGAR